MNLFIDSKNIQSFYGVIQYLNDSNESILKERKLLFGVDDMSILKIKLSKDFRKKIVSYAKKNQIDEKEAIREILNKALSKFDKNVKLLLTQPSNEENYTKIEFF